jgi:hypothetical protein
VRVMVARAYGERGCALCGSCRRRRLSRELLLFRARPRPSARVCARPRMWLSRREGLSHGAPRAQASAAPKATTQTLPRGDDDDEEGAMTSTSHDGLKRCLSETTEDDTRTHFDGWPPPPPPLGLGVPNEFIAHLQAPSSASSWRGAHCLRCVSVCVDGEWLADFVARR